jgi:hypothetical protein
MTVEVNHVDRIEQEITEIVGDVDDFEGDVQSVSEVQDPTGRTAYQVTGTVVMQKECYTVRTVDGTAKESRTYTIEKNDDNEWEVTRIYKSPKRGHDKVTKINPKSTETVRKALAEHGVEVVN